MPDNKIRLSHDVLEKAEQIATEWGLKNARAAVEAVFRRYCDDYLYGRAEPNSVPPARPALPDPAPVSSTLGNFTASCEALDVLDDLLAM